MGEAKRKYCMGLGGGGNGVIAGNLTETGPRESIRLMGALPGTPMSVALFGARLIPRAIEDGTMAAKLFDRRQSTDRHMWRLMFGVWDRVRTGEIDPWQCNTCRKSYSGLAHLSVMALVDCARDKPAKDKPGAIALICNTCDSISSEHTFDLVRRSFGLEPPIQQGHA
jgi:hypothetical protein